MLRLSNPFIRNVFALKTFSRNVSSLHIFSPAKKAAIPNRVFIFVPQQSAYVVERMGRFHRVLEPGLAVLAPLLDKIAYVHSLKERTIIIPSQSVITLDNIALSINGFLHTQVFDAYKASYEVENAEWAIEQHLCSSMRHEISQHPLNHVLKHRLSLNEVLNAKLNALTKKWGITCLRTEILDIKLPDVIEKTLHERETASRKKDTQMIAAEGRMMAMAKEAEGRKHAQLLSLEAQKTERLNKAAADAEALRYQMNALAEGIASIAKTLNIHRHGADAIGLQLAKEYISALSEMGKNAQTFVIPQNIMDVSSVVKEALNIGQSRPKSATVKTEKPNMDSAKQTNIDGVKV
ncbi:prohibitin [Schizosaccharomyces japonicus yFS275]|uniref:Prohibitin n=1 Tax=Schizosaccharomyces japonicus (strain yFS275 / FY16936) TaxID=402676 RepID=B6K3I3_SCHJY|nr:prohibitin [Schizosaccharomyces japonicus yFS275]EEB08040.2 prohibitin [Schizosaccharomyces japonicus yFS275]